MKKNIIVVTLLSVIMGSTYGEPMSDNNKNAAAQGRTWGQYFGQKAESLNKAVNLFYYDDSMPIHDFNFWRLLSGEKPISNFSDPYGQLRVINPQINHCYARKDGQAEVRALTLPVKELAIAGGAYLAGRWAWNKFITPEIKKIENKVNQLSKLNDQLINQIEKAKDNPKATPEEKAMLAIFENARLESQKIDIAMKNQIKDHRNQASSGK